MNRIIGKSIACLLFLLPTVLAARITLSSTDSSGRETTTVSVGEPFFIHVIVQDIASSVQIPEIPGLATLNARRVGVNMTSVNGNATIKHSYQAQVNTAGYYNIGPVHINIQGTKEASNALTLQVVHNSSGAKVQTSSTQLPTSRQARTSEKPIAVITTNMQEAYVGQKILCRLRCYYVAGAQPIEVRQVHIPELTGAVFHASDSPTSEGTEIINQKAYQYAEWMWTIYPQQAGNLVIPSYVIDYSLMDDTQQSFFGPLSFIFGGHFLERIHSNSATIKIKPVPGYQGKEVTAVGQFSQLNATVTPSLMQINEAALYTLTLKGIGNFPDISFIPLEDLPTQVTWYKSTMKEKEDTADVQVKDFEYVIQSTQAGEIIIPVQTLVTFDPVSEKHVLLTSQNCTLQVRDDGVAKTKKQEKKVLTKKSLHETNNKDQSKDIENNFLPLALSPITPYHDPLYLPWFFVFFLAFLPLLVYAHRYKYLVNQWLHTHLGVRVRPYYAFYKARKELQNAYRDNNMETLYTIFVSLVHRRTGIPEQHINLFDIQNYCTTSRKHTALNVHEWHSFVDQLQEYQFAQHRRSTKNMEIWQEVYSWLDKLRSGGL